MEKKAASGIMLTLLLIGMLTLAFNIQSIKAGPGTIYIRADGSVEPESAPIQNIGNVSYTFTDNINETIEVQRNNIIIDGNRYTLQTSEYGFYLPSINNVTIKNTDINCYIGGINLQSSSGITISGNNITNSRYGIGLSGSNYNNICGNKITVNNVYGIGLSGSNHNNISGNIMIDNDDCIRLFESSSYNNISGNYIANNVYGVRFYVSSNNVFYHNNFIHNVAQVYDFAWGAPVSPSINIWDDGYPSGGNYWSDYPSLEFYDDFRAGLEQWNNFGDPTPARFYDSGFHDFYGYSTKGDSEYQSGSWSNTLLDLSNGVTVEFRVKQDAGDVWDKFDIIGIGKIQSGYLENYWPYYFGVNIQGHNPDNNPEATDDIQYLVFSNGTLYPVYVEDAANDHQFHLFKIVYDGSTNLVEFYKDNNHVITLEVAPRSYDELPILVAGRDSHFSNYLDWIRAYPNQAEFDLYKGPYQNETGSDGLGDSPCIIDENNRDRYPLMKPYGGPYDIGITSLTTSKRAVGQGYNLNVNVTIVNYGINAETFNVTVYANATSFASQTITLLSRNSTTITFTWNTTGFVKGNYIISAVADKVSGETDTTDNSFIDGMVRVVKAGDFGTISGGYYDFDDLCDYQDLFLFRKAYIGAYEPLCDFDNNLSVDYLDLFQFRKCYINP